MKAVISTLTTLMLIALAWATKAAAQLVDPLDGGVLTQGETECLNKLNWPKCGGWNYEKLNLTIETDPGRKKFEAEVCNRECQDMFSSLSDDYLKKVCGPNYEFPRNRRRRLPLVSLGAADKCRKDEAGTFCFDLYDQVSKKFNFNASQLADDLQKANPVPVIIDSDEEWKAKVESVVVPWSKYPKDYACSKCAESDIDRLIKTKVFYNRSYHDPHMDISAKGIAERKELCAGWVAPKAAVATGDPSSADRHARGMLLVMTLAVVASAILCL